MNQGKVFEINLDFYKEIQNVVPIINNDDFNYIKFNLFSNGAPYTLADTENVFIKTSGHTFTVDALMWGLGSTAMELAGNNIAELQISSVDKRITTFRFAYKVVKTLSGNAIEIDDPALITLIQLNATVSALEQTISASEAIRVSDENIRKSNESERVPAEIIRVNNESARESGEVSRASAESTRISSEIARVLAENTRLESESQRVSAESTRLGNESGRVSAEASRNSAEITRVSAESGRVAAEQARVVEFAAMTDVVTPHIADKNNPHVVTKLQVGLGNVSDFGIATQAEAEAGTLDNKYMTPLKVKQAVAKSVEVVDARFSSERNVTYSTLKGRLDAIDTDIVKPKASTPVDATQPIISLPSTAVKGKLEGSLKGNTFYQAITNGDFANGTTGWEWSLGAGATYSVVNNILEISSVGTNATGIKVLTIATKNKYAIVIKCKNNTNITNHLRTRLVNSNINSFTIPISTKWQNLVFITDGIQNFDKFLVGSTSPYTGTFSLDYIMAIDMGTDSTNPLYNLTADQINNMIDGYWEGLGGTQPSRVKSIGANLFDGILEKGAINTTTGINGGGTDYNRTKNFIKVKPSSNYKFSSYINVGGAGKFWFEYDKNKNYLGVTSGDAITTKLNTSYVRWEYQNTNSIIADVPMLNEGATALPYEPYTETELYCPVPLSRVSATIFDEFDFDGKLTQRTAEKLNQTGIVNYVDMATGGSFIAQLSTGALQIGVKGDTLTATATKILYQLTTPGETYYPVSELIAEPSGTIYVDSKINVVKSYTTNIAITSKIKSLESIYKITGDVRTPISLSSVTVASDGMSIAITGAIAGEMYDIVYEIYGALLPTINYSYPLNLLAVAELNAKMIADLAGDLYAFRKMQNLINLQFDARLITGGH